jgi:transporter family-2 protein
MNSIINCVGEGTGGIFSVRRQLGIGDAVAIRIAARPYLNLRGESGMPQSLVLLGTTFLAMFAGWSFVMQQAVNADLRIALGSTAWAGFVSYLGGTVCMLIFALATGDSLSSDAAMFRSHWWAWSGGFFGALYIAISIILVPRIGAAAFVALLVAGQMLSSLIFDHYGLLGATAFPTTFPRLLGAGLLMGGVILIRL